MAFVYNCCFWFSLRLGGILITLFSMLQVVLFLLIIFFSKQVYQQNYDSIKCFFETEINLIYMKTFITSFLEDPDKYNTYIKIILCFYILGCFSYIYGAYKLNNILMTPYIFLELLRLTALFFFGVTGLLILKENTMDIGLLIGISVVVGFTLLALFYLWICVINLPILINEIKANEQAALLSTLRNLIEIREARNNSLFSQNQNPGRIIQSKEQNTMYRPNIFSTSKEPPKYYY